MLPRNLIEGESSAAFEALLAQSVQLTPEAASALREKQSLILTVRYLFGLLLNGIENLLLVTDGTSTAAESEANFKQLLSMLEFMAARMDQLGLTAGVEMKFDLENFVKAIVAGLNDEEFTRFQVLIGQAHPSDDKKHGDPEKKGVNANGAGGAAPENIGRKSRHNYKRKETEELPPDLLSLVEQWAKIPGVMQRTRTGIPVIAVSQRISQLVDASISNNWSYYTKMLTHGVDRFNKGELSTDSPFNEMSITIEGLLDVFEYIGIAKINIKRLQALVNGTEKIGSTAAPAEAKLSPEVREKLVTDMLNYLSNFSTNVTINRETTQTVVAIAVTDIEEFFLKATPETKILGQGTFIELIRTLLHRQGLKGVRETHDDGRKDQNHQYWIELEVLRPLVEAAVDLKCLNLPYTLEALEMISDLNASHPSGSEPPSSEQIAMIIETKGTDTPSSAYAPENPTPAEPIPVTKLLPAVNEPAYPAIPAIITPFERKPISSPFAATHLVEPSEPEVAVTSVIEEPPVTASPAVLELSLETASLAEDLLDTPTVAAEPEAAPVPAPLPASLEIVPPGQFVTRPATQVEATQEVDLQVIVETTSQMEVWVLMHPELQINGYMKYVPFDSLSQLIAGTDGSQPSQNRIARILKLTLAALRNFNIVPGTSINTSPQLRKREFVSSDDANRFAIELIRQESLNRTRINCYPEALTRYLETIRQKKADVPSLKLRSHEGWLMKWLAVGIERKYVGKNYNQEDAVLWAELINLVGPGMGMNQKDLWLGKILDQYRSRVTEFQVNIYKNLPAWVPLDIACDILAFADADLKVQLSIPNRLS